MPQYEKANSTEGRSKQAGLKENPSEQLIGSIRSNYDTAMLTTTRLLLRDWKNTDREPFAALNADPRVMRFMPTCLAANESDALLDRIQEQFRTWLWPICYSVADIRRVYWLHRTCCSGIQGEIYALRRGWMEIVCRELESGLSDRRGTSSAATRLRNTEAQRIGFFHGSSESCFETGDGKNWHGS